MVKGRGYSEVIMKLYIYCIIFYFRQIFKQFLTNRILTNPFQRRFFKSNDLYELFTLGDIGPMQSTETGAIFAGTGSVIRLRKKRKSTATKTSKIVPVSKRECKRTNTEINSKKSDGLTKDVSSLKRTEEKSSSESARNIWVVSERDKCVSDDDVDFVKSKDVVHINNKNLNGFEGQPGVSKKRQRRKKKKVVQIDGVAIQNVDKSERYRKESSEDEEEKKDHKSEDDVLLSLFRSSGIHSALRHDRIEQAGNPDYVFVEKEAERVANQAVKALRESRVQCESNAYTVPTWTGRGPSAKVGIKKQRFGKKSANKKEPVVGSSNKELLVNGMKSNVTNVESETIDISSSALLARMRNRNSLEPIITHDQQQNGICDDTQSSEDVLVKDILEFISQRMDGVATSEEIASFFKTRLDTSKNALLKELLKRLCNFKRTGSGTGEWQLKEEFL